MKPCRRVSGIFGVVIMQMLNCNNFDKVSGGGSVLEAEGVIFGDIALAAAVTGVEPVAVAFGVGALAADALNAAGA